MKYLQQIARNGKREDRQILRTFERSISTAVLWLAGGVALMRG
jgi:hypothetical protein